MLVVVVVVFVGPSWRSCSRTVSELQAVIARHTVAVCLVVRCAVVDVSSLVVFVVAIVVVVVVGVVNLVAPLAVHSPLSRGASGGGCG